MFERRKRQPKAYRPMLNGQAGEALEPRLLLAARVPRAVGVLPPALYHQGQRGILRDGIPKSPRAYVQTGVADGGRAAAMVDVDGELYVAHLTGGGTVRARAVPGGKVDLYLYGTTTESVLTIDPESPSQSKGTAHQFPPGSPWHDGLIHIRNITVTNGRIGQILGYRTADVSGKIKVQAPVPTGTTPVVDRIAFYRLLPGASVLVDGDLNTLDVYDSMTLGSGDVIKTGRDLNFVYAGRNIQLYDGAMIIAGRDIGGFAQAAKGSGPGGQGFLILGDLIVGPGSSIGAARYVRSFSTVYGSALGTSNLQPQFAASLQVLGQSLPNVP